MHFLIQKLDSQYQTMRQLPADADAADNTFTRIHDLLITCCLPIQFSITMLLPVPLQRNEARLFFTSTIKTNHVSTILNFE